MPSHNIEYVLRKLSWMREQLPFTFWFCHCQSNRINKDSRAFVGRGREQQRYERTYAAGQSQLIPLE